MMAKTASQLFLLRFSRQAGVTVILIGCLVLFGWLLNNPFLKSVTPHLIAMNPLTAVLFILSGTALLRAANTNVKVPDTIMMVCALIILIGGAAKVGECAFGLD